MLKRVPFEAICWLSGLVSLAWLNPHATHLSLCPLKNAGLDFCPGCGLGTSISLLLHGELMASLETHPLGMFAVVVLSLRIRDLTKQFLQNYGKSY